MIITTEQAKNGRINVYGDEEYIFSCSPDYWYSLNIYDGDDIAEDRIQEIIREIEINKCVNSAYGYLARRAHSENELRAKLLRKYDESAVDAAVEKARELGLLDDSAYAAEYADELIRRKHYAPSRIKAELMKRGISRAEASLAAESADFDAEAELSYLLEYKFKNTLRGADGIKKTTAALMRMGYSYSEIRSVLGNYTTDEVLNGEE